MKTQRLYRNPKACVACTACVAQCPREALEVVRPDYIVAFREASCTACGRCVSACAFAALEVRAHRREGRGAA